MDSIIVKFVLESGRIHKQTVVPANFARVLEVARGVCGSAVPNFYLSYDDAEGDTLTLKDDVDLKDAISSAEAAGMILRISINPEGEPCSGGVE